MPCSSSEGMASAPNYEDVARLKRELDRVTAILCEVMMGLPVGQAAKLSPEAKAWADEHWKFDAARELP